MMDDKDYTFSDEGMMTAAEPAAAMLSESVKQTGLFGQVMALSPKDKTARDYEEGRCLTEDDFKQRFARWL